jgi:hypothetical protein
MHMVRKAVITFTLLIVMFLTSFYLVLAANKSLDRTMAAVMKKDDITVTATEKTSPLSCISEKDVSKK